MNEFDRSGVVSQAIRAVDSEARLQCWSIEPETVVYRNEDWHTLSLYLKGGESSFRRDRRHRRGGPGRVSLMPQSHRSVWQVECPVSFVHLYFSDALFKRFAVETFDRDARLFDVIDLTYENDPLLRRYLLDGASSVRDGSPVSLQEGIYSVLHHLLTRYYNRFGSDGEMPGRGLSSSQRRQAVEFINANLGQKLTLDAIAGQTHLSPYHFARLFRASLGVSPGQYLQQARLECVREMLAGSTSLADISLAAGFTHQSHMTSSFRKRFLITPARYRQELRNR